MSRFDELCESANDALVADLRHRERCKQFGAELAKGLMRSLDVPNDRASHYLLVDGEKPVQTTMDSATYVDPDGWWRVGIGINLTKGDFGTIGKIVFFNLVYKCQK